MTCDTAETDDELPDEFVIEIALEHHPLTDDVHDEERFIVVEATTKAAAERARQLAAEECPNYCEATPIICDVRMPTAEGGVEAAYAETAREHGTIIDPEVTLNDC